MIKRDDLIKTINEIIGKDLLENALTTDVVANGIQFHGTDNVKKVVLGVSLNEDFLKEAVSADAQFCIFHHGFDPRTYQSLYSHASQKRLKLIFENNLTVAGYHYALDVHPKIGNNATIIKLLGAKIIEPLFEGWGYVAKLPKQEKIEDLAKKCSAIFEHDILAIYSGKKSISRIGVVSGGAKPYADHIAEMSQKGVELFITGESSESRPHMMKEEGINYFICGHYATEVFGVQELGKELKKIYKDKLEVEFIDIPNPL